MVKTVDAARAALAADTGNFFLLLLPYFEHKINFEFFFAYNWFRSNRSPREPYSSRGAQVLSSERSPLLAANSFKPPSFSNMSGKCASSPVCFSFIPLIIFFLHLMLFSRRWLGTWVGELEQQRQRARCLYWQQPQAPSY